MTNDFSKRSKEIKMVLKRSRISTLIVLALLLTVPGPAMAHRVNVFAWVEGETVHTESSFPGGREVNDGRIAVFDDRTGEKLLDGQTDEKGQFSFRIPRRTDLRIEMTAGMGHKNEWIVPLDEILAATGEAPPAASAAAAPENATIQEGSEKPAGAAPFSSAQIEAAVERAIDRKMAPLIKGMAELRKQKTTITDVFGGIGYIIGLAGVGVYIHYRRKIREISSGDS